MIVKLSPLLFLGLSIFTFTSSVIIRTRNHDVRPRISHLINGLLSQDLPEQTGIDDPEVRSYNYTESAVNGTSEKIDNSSRDIPPSKVDDTNSSLGVTEENSNTVIESSNSSLVLPVTSVSALQYVLQKYKGKVIECQSSLYPHCTFLLCGTIHVTKASAAMVEEVIRATCPQFVMLELCEARVDSLVEQQEQYNFTLQDIFQESYRTRSVKTFGMGLLSWMQLKAAKILGNQLGGEQTIAAKVGAQLGSMLVLGDRLYGITIQRVFDRLSLFGKFKVLIIFLWEIVTMSVLKLKEYIKKSEDDSTFIQKEIEKFGKYMPEVADTIIHERDEYMAQTLLEIARVGFGSGHRRQAGKVVAVLGAGHLIGVQRLLEAGGISEERLYNISISSKHSTSCWPGRGSLQIVNTQSLYPEVASPSHTPALSSQ